MSDHPERRRRKSLHATAMAARATAALAKEASYGEDAVHVFNGSPSFFLAHALKSTLALSDDKLANDDGLL